MLLLALLGVLAQVQNSCDIWITCDNSYVSFFNGITLGQGNAWSQAQYSSGVQLLDGKNVLAIKGVDAGGVAAILAQITTDIGNNFYSGITGRIQLSSNPNLRRHLESVYHRNSRLAFARLRLFLLGCGVRVWYFLFLSSSLLTR